MGQTAALIAGYQQAQHALDPHLGMLLGTRKFASTQAWFKAGAELLISCSQLAPSCFLAAGTIPSMFRMADRLACLLRLAKNP